MASAIAKLLTSVDAFLCESKLPESGGAGWRPMLIIIFLIGANYGSNLSLFPAASMDYFGMANFGAN